MKLFNRIMCLAVAMSSVAVSCSKSAIVPVNLRVESMQEPNCIDVAAPRLTWVDEPVSDKVCNESQSAYRIMVASSLKDLRSGKNLLWDTGKTESSCALRISYNGEPLASGQDCWWKVMVWDSKGKASAWSRPGHWTMGMMDPSQWTASWIGAPYQGEESDKVDQPAPLFRKEFSVKKKVKSAKAFVCGLGFFEMFLNGRRIGDDRLVPNLTGYTSREGLDKVFIALKDNFRGYRVTYLVYDVTKDLKEGENAAGVVVGAGFYNTNWERWTKAFGSQRLLCQIMIEYEDGEKESVVTDTSWKSAPSAITLNDVYHGETYDARLEHPGWTTVAYDDSSWQNAVSRKAPEGKLCASDAPLDRITETLEPKSLKKNPDGSYEVDFGTEISGWIHFKDIVGKAGDTLKVKFICESKEGDQLYVFKDSKPVSYAPRFTWFVFSKAVITGVGSLSEKNLVAEAVNNDVRIDSRFETSVGLLDSINTIWRRSQIDNMHGGIASDCPHRERSPYTGDGQVACATVMSNFDAEAFYRKWIRDMNDTQDVETGYVPNSAPWQPGCGGGVGWGAAMDIIPWEHYRHYADLNVLKDNYFAMKEQVRHMEGWITPEGTMFQKMTDVNSGSWQRWFNLGDWAPAYGLPSDELVHTFYLWYCADIVAKASRVVGTREDTEYYEGLAGRTRDAFMSKFYDPEGKTFGDYGSNVFALKMGVPEEIRADVVETLRKEIGDKYNGHLNTGIFGTRFLFEVLADNGLNDLAFKVITQRDFPSFGHWLAQGATTTWEMWDGSNSRNHPMFGGGLVWLYETLAGVRIDEKEPGYRHIIVEPLPATGLERVLYSKETPYGTVVSEVRNTPGGLELDLTVPVGSYATVTLPGQESRTVGQGKWHFQ